MAACSAASDSSTNAEGKRRFAHRLEIVDERCEKYSGTIARLAEENRATFVVRVDFDPVDNHIPINFRLFCGS